MLMLSTLSISSLQGQSRRYENVDLQDRLWYGLGFTGNYQGGNFSRTFVLGLAPMIGYKITDRLSFGPRFSGVVSFYRSNFISSQPESANPIDWSVGVFGRYRIAREFFAHVEYAFQNEAFIIADVNGLNIDRETNNAMYVGGGYSSPLNEVLAFEVSINLYVNQPFDDFRSPLNYRFGLNWNF